MSENVTYIPNRLKNAAKGGYVTGATDIVDDLKNKDQQTINQETDEALEQERREREQRDDYLRARIEAEEITREHNDNLLNNEINSKQLEIGAVETDMEPILESPNMLPSGAVAFNLGWYRGNENSEWIYIITDGARRILAGIKADGSVEWTVGVPTPVREYVEGRVNEIYAYIQQKIEENILAIEFEENGDIAAYYGEDGIIDDVYMDENGDIIVEQNVIVD